MPVPACTARCSPDSIECATADAIVSWFRRSVPPSARTASDSNSGTVGSSRTPRSYVPAPTASGGRLALADSPERSGVPNRQPVGNNAAVAEMTRFRLARMTGRDPAEPGRGSSPLELLFDLTFVVAVGTAAANFADTFAEGHLAAAFGALMLALFAICVSWINFSWFASGFGTDDWLDRVLTMVQMIGVVVLAIGIPPMFESVVAAGRVEFRLIVVGYVVMRAAMILQWLRVSRQSPVFRKVAAANAVCLILLQVGWVVLALPAPPWLTGERDATPHDSTRCGGVRQVPR